MAKGHSITGKVTGVHEHGDGKHVRVSVRHGRKPPKKKGEKNHFIGYDDRPESSLIVPVAHAGKYRVGQNVRASITDDDADDAPEDSMARTMKKAVRGAFGATRGRG